jgi:hypothetical protein
MTELKLPPGHAIRTLTDDFQLYMLVVEHLQSTTETDHMALLRWTYATARERRIPTECVSKVLHAVRLYEGLGK